MKVYGLRCDAMQNPLGISAAAPRLSWKMEAEERHVIQTAHQVVVSEDATGRIVYDSGMVRSQDNYMELPEICTMSSIRYNWRVTVWDNYGRESTSDEKAWFETGLLMGKDWKAKWIEPKQQPTVRDDYTGYWGEPKQSKTVDEDKLRPCPMLRKEFHVKGNVVCARAYATAHGIYRLLLNGKRVGNYEFAPEMTCYEQYLQVQTYDITDLLQKGDNVIGAVLADGWWAGRLGHYGIPVQYGDHLALLLQISIQFEDGTEEIIGSDGTFRSHFGERVYADLFIGEKYNANLADDGWMRPDYPANGWSEVVEKDYGYDNLVGQNAEHIQVLDIVDAKRVYTSPKGEKIIDFGQVMAGNASLHLKAEPGAVVTMRYFETTDPEGNFWFELDGRNSQMMDTYILDDTGERDYAPWFTYHGYRYIYIYADHGEVEVSNIKGRLIASKTVPMVGLLTSNEKVNRLQKNIEWTLRSNMPSILTDNPDRERAGWTGDLQMIAPTLCYNVDAQAFLRRWLTEAGIEQRENGDVPLVIPNWKLYNDMQMNSSAGWGDVVVIVPWIFYERYGDKRILEENYLMMKRWLGYIEERARENPEDIGEITSERAERLRYIWNADANFGDWLTPSACYNPETKEYVYFTQTLCYMMGTYYYAFSAGIMAKAAKVLEREEDAAYYRELEKKIQEAAIEEIYKTGGILGSEYMGAQILALHMGFYPKEEKQKLVDRLTELVSERGMDAGFSSALQISDILCENGYTEMAYDLLLNENFPSWLYEVNQGATSVWESMQAIMPDGTRNAVSFIQPALCSIGNWMIQGMGGISPIEPGFRKIRINPYITDRLDYVETAYQSEQGKIKCRWEQDTEHIKIEVQIPANTTAVVVIHEQDTDRIRESGKPLDIGGGILHVDSRDKETCIEIGSGNYKFTYTKLGNC